jgi:hypothetical protein
LIARHYPSISRPNRFFTLSHSHFCSSDVKAIAADLEHGQPLAHVFLRFPFLPDRMSFILKNLVKSYLAFAALFILHSWLAWAKSFSDCQEVDASLTAVLDSLAQIFDKTTFASVHYLSGLAISIFLLLFAVALRLTPGPFVKSLLNVIVLFFQTASELPDHCEQLLYETTVWIEGHAIERQCQAQTFLFSHEIQTAALDFENH